MAAHWTGTVVSDKELFTVPNSTSSFFTGYNYYDESARGLRPIIVI